MKTSDFDYFLPESLIAQTPVEPRSASRLLVYDRADKWILHRRFYELTDFLKEGDVLVRNTTKVLPARLRGRNARGTEIEVLLLRRNSLTEWETLLKPAKKVKIGERVYIRDGFFLTVKGVVPQTGGRIADFTYEGVFEDVLSQTGEMPLPPYIKEKLKDGSRYQTVYCNQSGSAAAPTAGLHFTEELLADLRRKGVIFADLLLHVGLGTFRPVKAEDIASHHMHSEHYEISREAAETVNRAKLEKRRVIAVGTTSVRTLESAADSDGLIKESKGETEIFIYPPYKFRCADGIITNFHLPKSTLLMLVSAFAGKDKTLEIYKTAVEEKYRFFSFGDAMFLR